MHDLFVCNIIKMVPYNGCSQMLHILLKTEKSLSPTPDACCPLLALRSIQLMTGEPQPRYSVLQLLGESGACGKNTEVDEADRVLAVVHIFLKY